MNAGGFEEDHVTADVTERPLTSCAENAHEDCGGGGRGGGGEQARPPPPAHPPLQPQRAHREKVTSHDKSDQSQPPPHASVFSYMLLCVHPMPLSDITDVLVCFTSEVPVAQSSIHSACFISFVMLRDDTHRMG